jgi:hypothetical protein
LKTSEHLQKAFPEPPMVAFKILTNLADHLIYTLSKKAEPNEAQKCNSPTPPLKYLKNIWEKTFTIFSNLT